MQRRPVLAVPFVTGLALAAWLAVSCGGGGGSPAGATPSAPPSAPPSGGSVGQACRLGGGSTTAACGRQSSQLAGHVIAAMDLLLSQKPQLFDKSDASPADSDNYRVLDKDAYLDGMLANLQAAGLCAQRDPDDYAQEQLQVKSENGFSESFDVLLGAGYIWHNGASYRSTCVPASFPVERSSDLPAVGSGCGRPYPPPLHNIVVSLHLDKVAFAVLDSTPIVGPDAAYCAAVGFTDGRALCPVRGEGSPEREGCEAWRVGNAEDTQRPGPTWRRNGALCGAAGGCENDDSNQYLLMVTAGGTYTACARNGICGQLQLRR